MDRGEGGEGGLGEGVGGHSDIGVMEFRCSILVTLSLLLLEDMCEGGHASGISGVITCRLGKVGTGGRT